MRAGDLTDQLARGQRPEAGFCQQLRRDLGHELGDLGVEQVDGAGQLARVAQRAARPVRAPLDQGIRATRRWVCSRTCSASAIGPRSTGSS
jgi:hypothetical protein